MEVGSFPVKGLQPITSSVKFRHFVREGKWARKLMDLWIGCLPTVKAEGLWSCRANQESCQKSYCWKGPKPQVLKHSKENGEWSHSNYSFPRTKLEDLVSPCLYLWEEFLLRNYLPVLPFAILKDWTNFLEGNRLIRFDLMRIHLASADYQSRLVCDLMQV